MDKKQVETVDGRTEGWVGGRADWRPTDGLMNEWMDG